MIRYEGSGIPDKMRPMLEWALNKAAEQMRDHGMVQVMIVGDADPNDVRSYSLVAGTLMTTDDSKDATAAIARLMLRAGRCDKYLFISEAWAWKDDAARQKMEEGSDEGRIECLVVFGGTRDEWFNLTIPIERDGESASLDFEAASCFGTKDSASVTGRFTKMLDERMPTDEEVSDAEFQIALVKSGVIEGIEMKEVTQRDDATVVEEEDDSKIN